MKLKGQTILITGGTSGIGRELAIQLLSLGNTVIVTGRDETRLDQFKSDFPALHTYQSDVSDPNAIASLYNAVIKDFPALNVLVNNAGIMRKLNLNTFGSDLNDITREIDTNFSGSIRMVMQFLPHLTKQKSAAIVNVSSGLAFVPYAISPVYSATKAAIHSFTLSLRVQLKNTNITVFELAPPVIDTPLFTKEFTLEDVGGVRPMDVKVLAKLAIAGIEKNHLEIRPGISNLLRLLSRIAPDFMVKQLSDKPVDRLLASK
jgi:uncharacterized oxidoreductase